MKINKGEEKQFFSHLPFELTEDQQTVIQEISADLSKTIPMNRLMVGDVGSGKTIVAAYALYATYLSGYSAVLMAPTQILAEQHHRTISELLRPMGITVDLMTGNTKTLPTKQAQHESLFDDRTHTIVVGTHALLANQDALGQVGLVVIDEQHRFGVKQRGMLTEPSKEGIMPHLLTMTATPIPRTIAKTLFGNLDISFLLTMPKGRQTIKTWLVPNERREKGYTWIDTQLSETGGQVFIICPLIESSETLTTVKAVNQEYEALQKIFPHRSIGLLHGRMKGAEKTEVLNNFSNKKHDILLATPVVEVGIDIPNATIILIEAAERFGLGQLHQLRGRVGRGKQQSYCLLYTESEEEGALTRLKAMESLHSGPQLAELDLHLRGAGDIFGTRQHGIPFLRVAQLTDGQLLDQTSTCADDILIRDPELTNFPLLRVKLKKVTIDEQIQD
jgi:ATP-dependent DNA helicase RecG